VYQPGTDAGNLSLALDLMHGVLSQALGIFFQSLFEILGQAALDVHRGEIGRASCRERV